RRGFASSLKRADDLARSGASEKADGIARSHRARGEHARVYPTRPRMAFLGDAGVVAVEKRARNVHAGGRVARDLDHQIIADLQNGLRHDGAPVETCDREVLTEPAPPDPMSFAPHPPH